MPVRSKGSGRFFRPGLVSARLIPPLVLACGLVTITLLQPGAILMAETADHEKTLEQLRAIGYLSGYETAPGAEGVTWHERALACPGLNLYTSGHESGAVLMDMDGRVLHRWSCDLKQAFTISEQKFKAMGARGKIPFWRRVHLYPNGDLLAIIIGCGLVKVDRDSNLLWSVPGDHHHDLHLDESGRIHVLNWKPEVIPSINEKKAVREDYIQVLDPGGKLLSELSLYRALADSSYAPLADRLPHRGHILHTNTLEILDGFQEHRSPIFSRGNVLTSFRSIDTIAIIDPAEAKVVWALTGQWIAQHQPTLLRNGNILLFDNRGHGGMSKIIEIDPFTQQICWSFEGNQSNGFYSESLGSCSRLANGNTLITQSHGGRVLEITHDGQIVWEFHNPDRFIKNGEHLIGTILEMQRLVPGAAAWLSEPTD